MRFFSTALALAVLAMPLAAQDTTTTSVAVKEPLPWRTSYFPYFTVSPNDGLMGIARVLLFRQAEFGERVTMRDAIAFEGGYSTSDAWFVRSRLDFPKLADGWRVAAALETGKQPKFGWPEDPVARTRSDIWIDATRRVHGRLGFALRGGVDYQHVTGDAGILYERYPLTYIEPVGCPPTFLCTNDTGYGVQQTDVNARAALVLDLRDREFDTRSGALIEGGLFTGTGGGDQSYYGGYAIARGWYSPRRGTRLTSRIGLQAVSKSDATGILQEMPAWESPITTFGGPNSHRGLGISQVSGRGRLLGGAELRHDLLNVGELGAITAVVFVDGGRVFSDPSPLVDPAPGAPVPSGDLQLTLKGWTVGGGGGIAIRVMRAAQLVVTAARGDGVTRWYVSTGWSW